MADWRNIPAADVDWAENPISRRGGYKVNMMCSSIYWRDGYSTQRSCGGWKDLTLGEIADLGESHWLKCQNIGPLGVQVIKWVIDAAAEGRCPMRPASGSPAPDAYVPKAERED